MSARGKPPHGSRSPSQARCDSCEESLDGRLETWIAEKGIKVAPRCYQSRTRVLASWRALVSRLETCTRGGGRPRGGAAPWRA
eukprot:2776088-Pleurochrysis_carterae.AAC.2